MLEGGRRVHNIGCDVRDLEFNETNYGLNGMEKDGCHNLGLSGPLS